MIMQGPIDYNEIISFLIGAGIAVLAVVLVFIIIFILIWLKIWAWAIKKRNGNVTGLGQVFLTLIICSIITLVMEYLISLVISYPLVGTIVSLLIESYIISKRHNMSFGDAFVAIILVFLVGILVLIIIVVILVVILLLVFQLSIPMTP